MVNPTAQIHTQRQLLGELGRVLDALQRTTGLEGRVVALEPEIPIGREADALVDIYVEEKKHRYVVVAKTRVDRLATLGQVKAQLHQLGKRGLLLAPYITQALAKECRKLDLAFLDMAGNAYLKLPGLHIYIAGEKPEAWAATTTGAKGGATATALRVVFALLCEPRLLNAPYREIVEAAGVALGAVGWVFFDLEQRGYIAGRKRQHNRRFLEPVRLLEEWVTNYPIKLRPKLNPRRFRADRPDWWRTADLTGLGACWGGEIAAHRLTAYLKPATCTIYIEPQKGNTAESTGRALTRLVAAHRLRAEPQGDIEVLDAFWHLPPDREHPDVVPPILAYADLIATLDPRNLETARLIREQYIERPLRQG